MGGRNWLLGARAGRSVEATPQAVAATGAAGGWGTDPVDGDTGYVRLGGGGAREQPQWTTEKARVFSVAAYRSNPMARAIIDTYTSFVVGDSGVKVQCTHPDVTAVVEQWWTDPRNRLAALQPLLCRDWLLQGEAIYEYLVGPTTGVVRFSPIDPVKVLRVELDRGNPLWHRALVLRNEGGELPIAAIDDLTELRTGRVGFFPSWRALLTDTRGVPFLAPVLDDLDAYGQVLSNLVDRTALSRYLVWDVTVTGGQTEVDEFVAARGGLHVPRSGSVEVHNDAVKWEPQTVSTGSFEDTNTALSVLTNVAGGAGLAKTWLAESEGANRATSLSMAEPVRRRVGGVQQEYLSIQTEFARYVVDQAVRVGRLPAMIETAAADGRTVMVPASQLVTITGPEIAAADSQVTATMLVNLSTALQNMVEAKVLTVEAAALAAQKAWEQFTGQALPAGLAIKPSAADDMAAEIEAANAEGRLFIVA
jgi:hypothetical protein